MRAIKKISAGFVFGSLLCWLWGGTAVAVAGEIFRYRDKEGVVHFSNAPTDRRFSRVGPRPDSAERSSHPDPAEQAARAPVEDAVVPGVANDPAAVAPPPGGTLSEAAPSTADSESDGGAAPSPSVVQPTDVPPVAIVRMIEETAVRYRLEMALLTAIVRAESGYDPRAVSRSGAAGLMQLMPETAASLGVEDVFHPRQNLEGGALYFRRLLHRFDGDPLLALAAFNAGPTAVERHGGIPPFPETQSYVRRVAAYRQEYLRSREGLPHMVRKRKTPES